MCKPTVCRRSAADTSLLRHGALLHCSTLSALLLVCTFATVDLPAAEFLLPEQLPGSPNPPILSADGQTVVLGDYNDGDPKLVRWSVANGVADIIDVGDLIPNGDGTIWPNDIAADGTIVGNLRLPDDRGSWRDGKGFRWTETGGIESLDPHRQYPITRAHGVSADGSVIVGTERDSFDGPSTSLIWNDSTSPTELGGLDGFAWSNARDVSDDGQVIVGQSKTPLGDRRVGWVWTAQDGFVATDSPTGSNRTHTTRVSGDGTVVAGAGGIGPFRWTREDGLELLGSPASGGDTGGPIVVSHDGSALLGFLNNRDGSVGSYVWDEENRVRDLESVLHDEHGLDVPAYENFHIGGISDNLDTLVGSLRERGQTAYQTWIINLDRPLIGPLPLPGDYNGNGMVEQADLDLVLLHWGSDASTVPDTWVNELPTDIVDQDELDGVLLNWGNTSGLAAASVPEPSTVALLLTALVLSSLRRKIIETG